MIKISDALKEIVKSNNFLDYGLSHGILNITQTADWIKPLVEVRTKKNVSKSALIMALSRIMRVKKKILPALEKIKLQNINIYL